MADNTNENNGIPMAENSEDDIIRDEDIDFEDDEDLEFDDDAEGAEAKEEVPVEDNAVVVFTAHTEKPQEDPPEVYTVALDSSPSNSGLAVSGGRDDCAYVWVINSGEVVLECTGHKNSVTCVGFSHDGTYVATADLDGLIKVWKISTKKEVWSYECGSDIMWLQWHQAGHVLLAGTQAGDVWVWKISTKDWSNFKLLESHGHPSLCGSILPNGTHVVVGYSDGVVKLWDIKNKKAVHVWQHSSAPEKEMPEEIDSEEDDKEGGGGGDMAAEAMEEEEEEAEEPVAILCVDCSANSNLVMSGCADSTVKIHSVSSGKLVSTFSCALNPDEDNSVNSVAFCPQVRYAATATNSGAVEVWDLHTSVVRHTLQHPQGVSKVKWSTSSLSPLLFTGCLDGMTRLWDARTGAIVTTLSGHARGNNILDFDVTRDGTCLVSASEDGTARVFDLRHTQS